jgi:hypothetical protein
MKEDGCPRRRCRVDDEGVRVMKACLVESVDVGIRGYRPPWQGPLNMISFVARSLIKKKNG